MGDWNTRAEPIQIWPVPIASRFTGTRDWHPGVGGVVWLHRTVRLGIYAKRGEQPAALSTGPCGSFSTRAPEDPGGGGDGADSVALAKPCKPPHSLGLDPQRVIFAAELEVGFSDLPSPADPTLVLGVLTAGCPAGPVRDEIAILRGPAPPFCATHRRQHGRLFSIRPNGPTGTGTQVECTTSRCAHAPVALSTVVARFDGEICWAHARGKIIPRGAPACRTRSCSRSSPPAGSVSPVTGRPAVICQPHIGR